MRARRGGTRDLLDLIPGSGSIALDFGARDGHLSKFAAERYETLVALNLMKPSIDHPCIVVVQGDAFNLPFADELTSRAAVDHIPRNRLTWEAVRE